LAAAGQHCKSSGDGPNHFPPYAAVKLLLNQHSQRQLFQRFVYSFFGRRWRGNKWSVDLCRYGIVKGFFCDFPLNHAWYKSCFIISLHSLGSWFRKRLFFFFFFSPSLLFFLFLLSYSFHTKGSVFVVIGLVVLKITFLHRGNLFLFLSISICPKSKIRLHLWEKTNCTCSDKCKFLCERCAQVECKCSDLASNWEPRLFD